MSGWETNHSLKTLATWFSLRLLPVCLILAARTMFKARNDPRNHPRNYASLPDTFSSGRSRAIDRASGGGWTRAINVASTPERRRMGRHAPTLSRGERNHASGELQAHPAGAIIYL